MASQFRPDAWWVSGASYMVSGVGVLLLALIVATVAPGNGQSAIGTTGVLAVALVGVVTIAWGCTRLNRDARLR